MILYDGVIYRLQKTGGVSVLFNELISRFSDDCFHLVVPDLKGRLDRYRDVGATECYDVFHSTYYRLPVNRNAKIVTTVHDFTYERYARGARKLVHSWQKNRAIEGADTIICVSQSTKEDLLDFCGSRHEGKVKVVRNGVSDEYYKITDTVVLPQVLFVGARGGYKNFIATVQALSTLRHLDLVCVGGGDFTQNELSFLRLNIPGRFRHAGFLTNRQLNDEYNKSICLVYPSLYEGFGIPVLEAMRAGCPVIAVNASSIPEVAGDAAYLLESGSVEEIRQSIDYFTLLQNRDVYIGRGFLQAQKFSWDFTFNETVAVYEELLGREILERA